MTDLPEDQKVAQKIIRCDTCGTGKKWVDAIGWYCPKPACNDPSSIYEQWNKYKALKKGGV